MPVVPGVESFWLVAAEVLAVSLVAAVAHLLPGEVLAQVAVVAA